MRDLTKNRHGIVELKVGAAAEKLPVLAAQFRLLIDELVQNALIAVKDIENPRIIIKASVKCRPIVGRRVLLLEVSDNGAGMTPDILQKAATPFFSTRAGNHVGLGLTGCSQMVSTLNGKLLIDSKRNVGTAVHVSIPVSQNAAA